MSHHILITVAQLCGLRRGIIRVINTILYENEF
jgi:hypothetical protein